MAFIDDVTKTDEQITKEMIDAMPDKYQKSVGFPIWDFFRAIAKSLMNIWNRVSYMANLNDLRNMSLEDLVLFVKQRRGIIWKDATKASGQLQIVNGTGTITIGDEFETADGTKFVATETKQVNTGDFVNIECTQSEIIGNVPMNTITVIPTTIQGIIEVTNPKAFTNGFVAETKEELYERYIEDLQNPITSGNIYNYRKWALEVAGVKKASIKPLWNGDNTVKVIIIDQNSKPASTELVAEVQEYIDPNSEGKGLGEAPIGAYCTVESATAENLKIDLRLKVKAGEDFETIKNRVKVSIDKYLADLAFSDPNSPDVVSYAQVGFAVLSTDGVDDYADLLLNDDTNNIEIPNSDTDRSVGVLNTFNATELKV